MFRAAHLIKRTLASAAALALAVPLAVSSVIASVIVSEGTAQAASDPFLKWQTIETAHFRINFYSGEEEVAQTVARLAEDINARLVPAVGWEPSQRTEIVLSDDSDSANGSATALPYNAIHLYVTAPDDLSPLGDIDDWYQELVTHEYTHILHTDHIHGIPAIVNAFLGKTVAPNQTEPHWMLEGLAVFEESERTSGGRLRSSEWNMFMRADVLENNLATLDQFSNDVRRWPQGNIWYLYGSFFMRWIADTYGEAAIRKMIDDYGGQIVPYGINRSTRRATGKTFEDLYIEWVADLKKGFAVQAAAIRASGIREGQRVTFGGQTVQHPRWIPGNAWPEHDGDLLTYLDDAHTTPGLYALDTHHLDRLHPAPVKKELMVRTNTFSTGGFEPDGKLLFNQVDFTRNLFAYDDLFELGAGERSVRGLEGKTRRLTNGFRATDPDVAPDGRRAVFVTNHRGTSFLQIADIDPNATKDLDKLRNVHALVPSYRFEQAYSPRWSPDGDHVAYSVWVKGGYRDIRLVDVQKGTYVQVTHDRAIDGGPSFSHDGRWLFFHSDRLGVMNVYAYELATGKTKRVTNVVNGAYQPEPSPDGKRLAYVGYTHEGFDLFVMDLDETQWTDAEPYVDSRPAAPPIPKDRRFAVGAYNPFETLRPRRFTVAVNQGDFGYQTTVGASGSDIAGWHSIGASMTVAFDKPELQGSINYTYSRLPFDLNFGLYRSISARGGFDFGNYKPTFVQEAIGGSTGISLPINHAYDGQNLSLSYSFQRIGYDLPTPPASAYNPYDQPSVPQGGFVGALHLGWSYGNTERYVWSVSNERGFNLSANFDLTDPALASNFKGYDASFNFEQYNPMPWLKNHVLAFHVGGGVSGGSFPGRSAFYVGGYFDEPVVDSVRNTIVQGGIVLRGYPVVAEAGSYYALFNAEYHFPIVNLEHGPSTLPIFLQRINGNVFVDYGSAFNSPETAEFKTGTGGELWFDFTFGYVIDMTFRAGFAHGWASEGLDKFYFLAAVPY